MQNLLHMLQDTEGNRLLVLWANDQRYDKRGTARQNDGARRQRSENGRLPWQEGKNGELLFVKLARKQVSLPICSEMNGDVEWQRKYVTAVWNI